MKNNKRGFTLIELLVVVLIIGILAAVAVPQYQKAVWKSRFTQARTMVKSLANAEEIYYLANGKYTGDINELNIDIPESNCSIDAQSNVGECVFPWGRCTLHPVQDIMCEINKNGSHYMAYSLWLNHSGYPGYRGCRSYVTDDLNDISNQICKSETGSNMPTTYGTAYNSWHYID